MLPLKMFFFGGGWCPISWPLCVILVVSNHFLFFTRIPSRKWCNFTCTYCFKLGREKPPTSSTFRMSIAPLHHQNREKKGPSKHRRDGKGWIPILVSPESLNTSPLKTKTIPKRVPDRNLRSHHGWPNSFFFNLNVCHEDFVPLLSWMKLVYPQMVSHDEIGLKTTREISWWNHRNSHDS